MDRLIINEPTYNTGSFQTFMFDQDIIGKNMKGVFGRHVSVVANRVVFKNYMILEERKVSFSGMVIAILRVMFQQPPEVPIVKKYLQKTLQVRTLKVMAANYTLMTSVMGTLIQGINDKLICGSFPLQNEMIIGTEECPEIFTIPESEFLFIPGKRKPTNTELANGDYRFIKEYLDAYKPTGENKPAADALYTEILKYKRKAGHP